MRRSLMLLGVVCVLPSAAVAQSRDSSKTPAPSPLPSGTPACCAVVRIEADKALVTARETATGFTFRFSVKSRRLLGTLKIGQLVWADFTAKNVRLKATDTTPCCIIVETPPTDALGANDGAHAPEFRKEQL